jgi:FkbM family methyltransferase
MPVPTAPPFAIQTDAGWCLKNDVYTPKIISTGKLLCEQQTMWDAVMRLLGERRGLALDIGGFVGETAKYFMAHGFDVAAFECRPDAFWCMQQNCPSAMCYNVPLGDGGFVSLPISEGGNMGGRPVIVANDGNGATRSYRLDEFNFKNVGFIKIDVEGFEPLVLKGGMNTLACGCPVMIEFNLPALRLNGFEQKDIWQFFPGRTGKEVYRYGKEQWDVLYL